MKISHQRLTPEITSAYIEHGCLEERLDIHDVAFDTGKRVASAQADVYTDFQNNYEQGDNSYHWSAITAYRAVSQIAVAYLCTALGKTKREIGEILQISSAMQTKKPITQKTNVPIEVKFPKYIKRETKTFGELEFDVAEGSFTGSIRFAINH